MSNKNIENQSPLRRGYKLGTFEIIKTLGQGGFGITYLALDETTNKPIVIKEYFPQHISMRAHMETNVSILSSDKRDDFTNGLRRFEREASILGGFKHPNIVKVLSAFKANNTEYFVMDYIEGKSLKDYQKDKGEPLTEKEIVNDVLPALDGLALVHSKEILHFDIKPENILQTRYGKPILIDFGGARVMTSKESQYLSSHSSMIATDGYAPVEQYTSSRDQTAATDLYAFGMTLYTLISPKTELPKSVDRQISIFDGLDDLLPNIRKVAKGYSDCLYEAIEQCTQIRQKDRVQSVAELKNLLEPLLSSAGDQAVLTDEMKPGDSQQNDNKLPEKTGKLFKKFLISLTALTILGGIGSHFNWFNDNQAVTTSSTTEDIQEIDVETAAEPAEQENLKRIEKTKEWKIRIKDGTWGYVNNDDEFMIEPQFDYAHIFSNGFAAVKTGNNWGYIDTKGNSIVSAQFDIAREFTENKLAIVKKDKQYGAVNAEGKVVINLQFDWIGDFAQNGLAVARKNGKTGYINVDGAWAIKPQFDAAFSFSSDDVAVVEINKQDGLINANGEWVVKPQFDNIGSFSEQGVAIVMNDHKYGLINAKGELILRPQFEGIGQFSSNGLAVVTQASEQGNQYGFMNTNGEMVISPQYDNVYNFSDNGLAAVRQNEKWGYINSRGNWVIEAQFDWAQSFDDSELAIVALNGKRGLINGKGEWGFEPNFEQIWQTPDKNVALVREGSRYGLIRVDGIWILKPEITGLYDASFRDGLLISKKNNKWGAIDVGGKWIIEPQFDEIDHFRDIGLAAAKKGDKWGFINRRGNWVIEPQFDKAYSFRANIGLAAAKKGDKWGFIDSRGEWVIEPQFDDTGAFYSGVNVAKKLGKWGVIGSSGQWVIEPQFDDAYMLTHEDHEDHFIIYVSKYNKKYTIDEQGHCINARDCEQFEFSTLMQRLIEYADGKKTGRKYLNDIDIVNIPLPPEASGRQLDIGLKKVETDSFDCSINNIYQFGSCSEEGVNVDVDVEKNIARLATDSFNSSYFNKFLKTYWYWKIIDLKDGTYLFTQRKPFVNKETGQMFILAAIVSKDLKLLDTFFLHLYAELTEKQAVNIIHAAKYDKSLLISMEGNSACYAENTKDEHNEKMGFLIKLNLKDSYKVEWVSPAKSSNARFEVIGNVIYSPYGGSCQKDYIYKLNAQTGEVLARDLVPKAYYWLLHKNGKLYGQDYDDTENKVHELVFP